MLFVGSLPLVILAYSVNAIGIE